MSPAVGVAVVLLVTALVYVPSLSGDFVFEDRNDFSTLTRPFALADVAVMPARSLTRLSYALSDWLSPLEPWGYHAVSVGVHLLNVWLVWLVARAVLVAWSAVLAAALFALHPIQVEAVAYISARADLVSTTAILCALLALESRRWGLVLVASAAAVLGKETAIALGLLVPLWVWYRAIRVPFRVWAVWAMVAAVLSGYFVLRYPIALSLLDMGGTLMALTSLLTGLVWPVGLTIDPDWRWSQPMQVAGLLWLVAVPGWLSQRSLVTFAALWSLACVAPRLLVPLVEGLHEHHLYSVSVGWCLCAGYWLGPSAHGAITYGRQS